MTYLVQIPVWIVISKRHCSLVDVILQVKYLYYRLQISLHSATLKIKILLPALKARILRLNIDGE